MIKAGLIGAVVVAALAVAIWGLAPLIVGAHCDTMDGPVVTTAKAALEKGDVTPVLKWVKENLPRQAEQRLLPSPNLSPLGRGNGEGAIPPRRD
jgi:hypothetical protein